MSSVADIALRESEFLLMLEERHYAISGSQFENTIGELGLLSNMGE